MADVGHSGQSLITELTGNALITEVFLVQCIEIDLPCEREERVYIK